MKCIHSHPSKITIPQLSVSALLLLTALVYAQIPDRWQIPCLFYHRIGVPCPTCGTTRCAQLILQGNLNSAFLQQPLIFCAFILFGLFLLYHLICRGLRQPILSIQLETRRERILFGLFAMLLIAINWVYIIGN